jgi:tetratricopeptide (TPR) repeat protein
MNDRIEQLISQGREHYHANEFDKAEPCLAEATRARPSFPDLYNMLGVIYHAQGRFQDAEEAFEAALRINPRYTDAALNLSVTYNDRGKYEQARDVYSRVVHAITPPPATISDVGHRGVDQFARGKLANMHADLGAAYSGLGLHDAAVREYSQALALCPDFADLRVRLGNVYRDMARFEEAIAEFEQAKTLRPAFVLARIHLGVTLYSLGRRDEAVAEWQAVLDRDPANKSAQLYLRMVNDPNGPKPGSALTR